MALRPGAVYGVLKELRAGASGPLVVTGARELADALAKELGAGRGPVEGAAAVVHGLAAPVSTEDEAVLKRARRARAPVVAVLAGPELDARVPYVLATDVVRVPAGSGFPVDEIARVLAGRLGEAATPLAARHPWLREAVCEELIASFSRKNGILGAAIFIPGADLPVLTLNQLRLVLRIADAHGVEVGQERLPEILGVVGSGFALRALARQALGLVPLAGWMTKGAVAYAGTRALGEAAVRYFRAAAERRAGPRRPT